MSRRVGKGVSTALATIAIIFVLVLGLVWSAYMLSLNARQQAQIAGQAETVALKAKELLRVFIWLDPVRQPTGSYLNLTRISFVGGWSGETTINSLLIVWRDGRVEEKPVSIRLGAGEDRTYTPSELGIAGVDDYYAALAAIKYIQAHTSLGNDFVSLWGRPDKPALYVTGTTRTDTYTVTTTTTSVTATTTTRTRTTTSYTTTWTSRTTRESAPYLRASYGCDNVIFFTFRANGWGTAPYFIAIYRNDRLIGSVMTSGSWHGSAEPFIGNEGWTVVVTDVMGRQAVWSGQYSQPSSCNPPPTTTQPPTTTPPGPTTSPPTTQPPGTTTVWLTDTVTVTSFVYVGGATYTTVTVTATSTNYRYVTVTTTYTNTDLYKVTATQTHTMPYVYTTEVTVTMYAGNPIVALSARSLRPICSVPELRLTPSGGSPAVVGWRAVAETLAVLGALYTVGARRRVWQYLAMAALIAMMAWALEPRQASGLSIQDVITYKTTVTITVTSTVSVTGGTYTYVSTSWVAVTSTVTETHVEIVTTTTTVTTYVTVTEWTAISTVTNTVHPCRCRGLWSCEAPC